MLQFLAAAKTDRKKQVKRDEFKRRLWNFKVAFNEYGNDTQKEEEDGGVAQVVR
jgi:hypothetical protein